MLDVGSSSLLVSLYIHLLLHVHVPQDHENNKTEEDLKKKEENVTIIDMIM